MHINRAAPKAGSGSASPLKRVLGRRDLILFFVVAVANLNIIPAIASAGALTVWLWLLALFLYFWPQGAAVIELSQRWPGEGGIYLWAKLSFGEQHGFLAGWCYWLSCVVYLPTVLLSCIGVGVYVFGPRVQELANNHRFTAAIAIAMLLFLLAINIRGLELGKWVNNLGGIGIAGGAAIICILAVAMLHRHEVVVRAADFQPHLSDWRLLATFGIICYSLQGLDLASIMGDEIREPRRILPSAIFWGGLLSAIIYLVATLAMLVAMPSRQIGETSGLLQAINIMAERAHWTDVVAPLALLECVAIFGTASAWYSGSARLPFVAGIDRYLPAVIGRIHSRYRTPYVALTLFAVLSGLLIAMSYWGASVGEAYLTLLDLAVILQMVPNAYLFGALLKFALPRNAALYKNRRYVLCNAIFGLLSTCIGLVVAFIPVVQVRSIWLYECKLIVACVAIFGSAYGFYRHSANTQKNLSASRANLP